jgi:hypothetical protein
MQIDSKVFTPFVLHYSASAAAAASPVAQLCASLSHSSSLGEGDSADMDGRDSSDARSNTDDDEAPLVIVTAASSDFFNNSLNLIGR